jgi:nitrite reductase/ring-hydroxylating ferredoxin subunit
MSGLPGFPHKTFATGWYQIDWSAALAAGTLRAAKYFDQDLVIFRTESGKVVVMEAFCRHMGAHLGHGGKVSGEDIVCPFHGWKWSCAGANTAVPYSKQGSSRAQMRTWPTVEVSGLVLMWYHPAGEAPDYEPPPVPEFADPAYYPVYPHGTAKETVKFPPQLMPENGIDFPHLKHVHKWDVGEPQLELFEDHGRSFHVVASGGIETKRGPVRIRTQMTYWGVGLVYSSHTGLRDMGFVSGCIPIDHTYSELRLSTAVKRKSPDDVGDTPDNLALGMIRGQNSEVLGVHSGGDRDIWENMQYNPTPALVREEAAGHVAVRKWAAKFYSDAPAPSRETVAAR